MTQRKKLIELIHEFGFSGYEMNDLADYLIANGVVALPCKVGDKFYLVYEFGASEERECCGFSVFNGEIEIVDEVDSRYRDGENEYYKLFFTREEAEAALKKMEGVNE